MRLPEPPLLIITDRRQARRPLEEVAEACLAGGCRWLSLREKDLPPADRLTLLRRLVEIGKRYGATVGVHDDIAAAFASRCGAIHLPDGTSARAARRRAGKEVVIGVSAHDRPGVAAAARDGADYATLSPIFLSASKPEYGPALGLDTLAEIARGAGLPLVALGGIAAAAVPSVLAAGAAGVAVMGEVMRAADHEHVTAALVAALAAARAGYHSPGRR